MTIQDLHIAVKMELDKNVISGYPSFTDEQIDYFINRAYLMLINQKFTGHNEIQAGFEGNKKRIADLNNLLIEVSLPGVNTSGNEYLFHKTASDILFGISQSIEWPSIEGITNKNVVEVDHDVSNKFIKTKINNPWIPEPVMVWEQDVIKIYVDPIEVEAYESADAVLKLTYLKRPERLQLYKYVSGNRVPNLSGDATQIPEISEHVHQEIVSLTVDLMLDNIESQRIQTHPQLTQIKE